MIELAVPFNRPTFLGAETSFMEDAARQTSVSGGGKYCKRCEAHFREVMGCSGAFLTPSCTSALEMAALVLGIGPGDEVIVPSYTFVTSASAFVIFGATAVFVDVDPGTMNIDPDVVEAAITERTKAIVVVHYGGIVCDMQTINTIARRHGIPVVEDAAHAIGATRNGKLAGTFGALAAFSFHETKNITSGGEGGLLVVNDPSMLELARVVRDKGTNRAAFQDGRVDKYSWVAKGSSYLMNEVSAAWLWCQLERLPQINERRCRIVDRYRAALDPLKSEGLLEFQTIPADVVSNGHLFFVKTNDFEERRAFLSFLAEREVYAVFHYAPLHSSSAGRKFGRFSGSDLYTSDSADRLVRLPLFFNLTDDQQTRVIESVLDFFRE